MRKRDSLSSEILVYGLLVLIVGAVVVMGINYMSSQKHDDKDVAASIALNKGATTMLKSSDGAVLVVVPAGAATSSKEISIKTVENPTIDSKKRASEIYQLGPAGTIFSNSVEIRIKYDPKIVGDCPSLINFYHYNEDGTLKEYVASKNVYCSSHIASFDIDSFSFGYVGKAVRDEESNKILSSLTGNVASGDGGESCGDGNCDGSEDCNSCSADCGACPGPTTPSPTNYNVGIQITPDRDINPTQTITLSIYGGPFSAPSGSNRVLRIYLDNQEKKSCNLPLPTTADIDNCLYRFAANSISIGEHTYYAEIKEGSTVLGRNPASETKKFTISSSSTCGNGVRDSSEQCDDGLNNGACPKTCSSSCATNSCTGTNQNQCNGNPGQSSNGIPCQNGPDYRARMQGPWDFPRFDGDPVGIRYSPRWDIFYYAQCIDPACPGALQIVLDKVRADGKITKPGCNGGQSISFDSQGNLKLCSDEADSYVGIRGSGSGAYWLVAYYNSGGSSGGGGNTGAGGLFGNDIPNPPDVSEDFSNVNWLNGRGGNDVSSYSQTATLNSVTFSRTDMFYDWIGGDNWQDGPVFPGWKGVIGNTWIFFYRDGKWQAAASDWMGNTHPLPRELFSGIGVGGARLLGNFQPQNGEKYGFMISSLGGRTSFTTNTKERTNVIMTTWTGPTPSGGNDPNNNGQCGQGNYFSKLEGFDYNKFNNCNHQTPKYKAARVFSNFASPQITNDVIKKLNDAGMMATLVSGSKDVIDFKIEYEPGKQVGKIDVIRSVGSNGVGEAWQWLPVGDSGSTTSVSGECNDPTGTLPQVDSLSAATLSTGGTLTINGKFLTRTIQFYGDNGKSSYIGAVNSDCSRATINIPNDLPSGTYTVKVYKARDKISNGKTLTITGTAITNNGNNPTFNIQSCAEDMNDLGARDGIFAKDDGAAFTQCRDVVWMVRNTNTALACSPDFTYIGIPAATWRGWVENEAKAVLDACALVNHDGNDPPQLIENLRSALEKYWKNCIHRKGISCVCNPNPADPICGPFVPLIGNQNNDTVLRTINIPTVPSIIWSPKQTINGWFPQISPDGRYVTYGFGETWVADLQSGEERSFTISTGQSFSGQWIKPDMLTFINFISQSDNAADRYEVNVGEWVTKKTNEDSSLVSGNQFVASDNHWASWTANTRNNYFRIAYDNAVLATDVGGALSISEDWIAHAADKDNSAIQVWKNKQKIATYIPQTPLHAMSINKGYITYGGYGPVHGINPEGQDVDLTVAPWRWEGVGGVVFVNNQPWVYTLTWNDAQSKGYIFIRPWGEKASIVIEAAAVSVHVVYVNNEFIIAYNGDRGQLKVVKIPANSQRVDLSNPTTTTTLNPTSLATNPSDDFPRASPVCGNGVKEENEQCDDGLNNGACPKTCSTSCMTNSCITDDGPPNPPPNPNDGSLDMLDYIVGKGSNWPRTGTHGMDRVLGNNALWYIKFNDPKAFEIWRWDNNYIYHHEDRTDGENCPYHFIDGKWAKRWMKVGESVTVNTRIQRYNINSCQLVETCPNPSVKSGNFGYTNTLIERYPNYNAGGDIGTADVVVLEYSPGVRYEKFYFAKDWGWFKWEYLNRDTGEMLLSATFNTIGGSRVNPAASCVPLP